MTAQQLLKALLLASVCLPSNALAQQAPQNTNIAGPSASATGNVTNQAVQVLQGPFAINSYGSGVTCQGPTVSVTPFVTGNRNYNQDPSTYPSGAGLHTLLLALVVDHRIARQGKCAQFGTMILR